MSHVAAQLFDIHVPIYLGINLENLYVQIISHVLMYIFTNDGHIQSIKSWCFLSQILFGYLFFHSLLPFTSIAPHPLYPFPLSILFLYLFPALLFSFLFSGCAVYFCQPDALKGSLTVTMREVRPTLFFSVPRVWEKIQEKMVQMGRQTTGVKKVTLFISTPIYLSIDLFCR